MMLKFAVSPGSVSRVFGSFTIPPMSESEFGEIQIKLEPPRDYAFANKRHTKTKEFMSKEGLLTLWKPSKDNSRVISFLLSQQRARSKIDIMLMGRVPSQVIADRVNGEFRYRKAITSEMFETYHHFFWNTDLPTPREWHNYLAGHPHRDALMASVLGLDYLLVSRAVYNTANVAQTDSISAIIDDDCLVCIVKPGADMMTVSSLKTFTWAPGGGQGEVTTYYSSESRANIVQHVEQWDQKLIASGGGYFFSDIV